MPVSFTFFNIRTYTLGVRHTPNQTDSDVTCSRACDQGKITKKAWKIYMDVQLIFRDKFQNCPISTWLLYLAFWCISCTFF